MIRELVQNAFNERMNMNIPVYIAIFIPVFTILVTTYCRISMKLGKISI